jgi:hypothetical protein
MTSGRDEKEGERERTGEKLGSGARIFRAITHTENVCLCASA